MIKKALLAGLAVAALLPGMAQAQISCEQQQSSRTAGTLAGAGIGGAVLGNKIAKSSAN